MHQKNRTEIMWFRRSRCFIWEVSCVTIAVLGLYWKNVVALQGRTLNYWAVFGTTFFSQRQRKSEFLKLLSKLVCCLHIAWLNKAELRRLKIVLERNGRQKKSSILTYRQWVLLGKIATAVVGGADRDEARFSSLKKWKILPRPFCFAWRQ